MSKTIKWSIGCFLAIVLVLGVVLVGLYLVSRHNPPEYANQGEIVLEFSGKRKAADLFLSVPDGNPYGYKFYLSPGTPEDIDLFRERDAAFRIQFFGADGLRIKEIVVLGKDMKLGSLYDRPSLYSSGGFTHSDGPLLPKVVRWNVVYEEGP